MYRAVQGIFHEGQPFVKMYHGVSLTFLDQSGPMCPPSSAEQFFELFSTSRCKYICILYISM